MLNSYVMGQRPTEIVRLAMQKFGLTRDAAWADWDAVKAELAEYWQGLADPAKRESLLGAVADRYWEVARLAMERQELTTVIAASRELLKMLGAYPSESLTLKGTGPGGKFEFVTFVDHLVTRDDNSSSPSDGDNAGRQTAPELAPRPAEGTPE
jgi:hypothetical protein